MTEDSTSSVKNPPSEAASTARLFDIPNVVDSDDWYTPAWIFDGLGLAFDLDVAAPDGGAPNVPTARWYAVADDGLSLGWDGVVWCNPPFSAPLPWCSRWAVHEPGGIILLRSDMSTQGVLRAFTAASTMYVPPKRLQFVSSGATTSGVAFSSVLFGRGDVADEGLFRLARTYGGETRTLERGI